LKTFVEPLEQRQLLAAVTGLTLVNSASQDVIPLSSGAAINLANLPAGQLEVRADVSGETRSVQLRVDGRRWLDNATPFTTTGRVRLGPGQHILSAVAFNRRNGNGPAGTPFNATITIVDEPVLPKRAEVAQLSSAISAADATPPDLPGNWHLSFNEDFNVGLDTGTWSRRYWWNGTILKKELEVYDDSAVSVSDGALSLTASPIGDTHILTGKAAIKHPYVSGMVTTGGVKKHQPAGYIFKYGYAEARIQIPSGQGLLPAFWMLPASYKDIKGEIDAVEIAGQEPSVIQMHYHRGKKVYGNDNNTQINLSRGYHTYAVDWQPDHIAWYFDGVEQFRFSNAKQIISEPMYLLFTLAIGGKWPGNPDATTPFPSSMKVDWVHVWQQD
jgi:beta-glucanase (GH16 family)